MEAARAATTADVAAVAELAEVAVAEQADARGGVVWSVREARSLPATDLLTAAVLDPAHHVAVGTIDEVIVGYAVATFEDLRDGSRLGVVHDVYVEAEARSVGVGEALLESVVGWCQEQGCAGIDATVLPGNRATKNFFETFGFTARAIVVHRRLEES